MVMLPLSGAADPPRCSSGGVLPDVVVAAARKPTRYSCRVATSAVPCCTYIGGVLLYSGESGVPLLPGRSSPLLMGIMTSVAISLVHCSSEQMEPSRWGSGSHQGSAFIACEEEEDGGGEW